MKMPELAVGVDEFTLVLRSSGRLDVMDWLEELDKIIEEFIKLSHIEELYGELDVATKKIQAGYTNGLTILDRPWHFMVCWHEDIPKMGVCIKFSAHAWVVYRQDYETKYNTKMNVAVFLQMVKSDIYTMRLSRIDLTADYKNYPNPLAPNTHLNPNTLYGQLIKGRYVIKNSKNKQVIRTLSALDKDGTYETFYAGSRKGKTDGFLRCYDKRQEQIDTTGYRYDEAIQCESWVRFEAVYKGIYAHQITEGLQQVSTEDELKQLIAKYISDKYQFYDTATGDALQITEDLAGMALGSKVGELSCPSSRDNTIRQSVRYLKENSGLFAIFYKVYDVWGFDGEWELYLHLREEYRTKYRAEAEKKPEMINWHKKHHAELKKQKLKDNFI